MKSVKAVIDRRILIPLTVILLIGVVYINLPMHVKVSIDNYDPTISDKKLIRIYSNMIDALRKPKRNSNLYRKRPETEHVDCGKVLRKDKNYISVLTRENRIPLIKNPHLKMSCSAIQHRIISESSSFRQLKSGGVAFARIVYNGYEFIEKQIEMSWHPQNVFCFTIDNKSPREFQMRMNRLSECLDNIIVLPVMEEYDSSGHNINLGHRRCMEALLQYPKWTYLLHLQNNDVIIKSIYEIERIFEIFGGANDVNIVKEIGERRVSGLKWDPMSMKLFRNESLIDRKVLLEPMKVVSGSVQSSWSRAAVKWLIEDVDLTIAINQFNKTVYGGDEQLFPSLQVNKEYGMPGHYTHECLNHTFGYEQITRLAQWASGDINNCVTKTVRNGVCLGGIEEFRAISKIPVIVFNKMIPSFDYALIECTAELLYNRTFLGQIDYELDEKYYESLPTVQYHKHNKDPSYKLNCTPSHNVWKYEDFL